MKKDLKKIKETLIENYLTFWQDQAEMHLSNQNQKDYKIDSETVENFALEDADNAFERIRENYHPKIDYSHRISLRNITLDYGDIDYAILDQLLIKK